MQRPRTGPKRRTRTTLATVVARVSPVSRRRPQARRTSQPMGFGPRVIGGRPHRPALQPVEQCEDADDGERLEGGADHDQHEADRHPDVEQRPHEASLVALAGSMASAS